jgi:pectate lyase
LLFFTSLNPVVAAEVWSDNFDDGNYDGWTVTTGEWDATTNALETYYATTSVHMCRIWHESNVTVGTWSFDVFYPHSNPEPVILFMANGTDPVGAQEDDYQGYGLRISDDNIFLLIQDGDWDRGTQLLASAEVGDWVGTWTSFDITRDSDGVIKVYVNATSNVAVADISHSPLTEFSYSERFVIDSHFGDTTFDNIVVSDTIDITEPVTGTTSTTTTTTTTTIDGTTPPLDMTMLIIAGGGIAVVAVIIVIVKLR